MWLLPILLVSGLFVMAEPKSKKTEGRVVHPDQTELRNELLYIKEEKKPYTGTVAGIKTVYQDDTDYQLNSSTSYREGEYHGWSRTWHNNVKLKPNRPRIGLSSEGYSVDGKFLGIARRWHDNGNLDSECFYAGWINVGPSRRFHDNGNLASLICYDENEKWHGYATSFHESGKPQRSGLWIHGKRDGLHLEWSKEGKIISSTYYSVKQDKEVTEKIWLAEQAEAAEKGKIPYFDKKKATIQKKVSP